MANFDLSITELIVCLYTIPANFIQILKNTLQPLTIKTQKYIFLYAISTEMCGNTVLHLCLLGLLLADVFLHAVVQDGADAEGLVLLDQRPDGHVVLTGDKLAIKRHLHELVEGSLAQDLLT